MRENEDFLFDDLNTENGNLNQRMFSNKITVTKSNSNSTQKNGNLNQRAFTNKQNSKHIKNNSISKNKISIHIPASVSYYLKLVKARIFNLYTVWFIACCLIDSYIMIGVLDFEAESALDIILFILVLFFPARVSSIKLHGYIKFNDGYILKYMIAILKAIMWNFFEFASFLIVACCIYGCSEIRDWLFE